MKKIKQFYQGHNGMVGSFYWELEKHSKEMWLSSRKGWFNQVKVNKFIAEKTDEIIIASRKLEVLLIIVISLVNIFIKI